MVRTLNWKSLVVLFQDENSLVRLQELHKLPKSYEDVKISYRQLDLDTDDYRPLLKEIKKTGETRMVLDCDFEKVGNILKQADEIGMITEYHNYLISKLSIPPMIFSHYMIPFLKIRLYWKLKILRSQFLDHGNII